MAIKNKYFVNEIFVWNESKYDSDMGEHYNYWHGAYIVTRDFSLMDEFKSFYNMDENDEIDMSDDRPDNFIQYLIDYGNITPLKSFEIEVKNNYFRNVTLNQTIYKKDTSIDKYILVDKNNLENYFIHGIKASIINPLILYDLQGAYFQEEIKKVISSSNETLVKIKIRISSSDMIVITEGKTLYITDVNPHQIIRE